MLTDHKNTLGFGKKFEKLVFLYIDKASGEVLNIFNYTAFDA